MMDASSLGSIFQTMLDTMTISLRDMSGTLMDDGLELAGVLLLITTAWTVFIWILSGDGPQALVDWVGTMARYAIVSVLLAGWVGWMGGYFEAAANDISTRISAAGAGAGGTGGGGILQQSATIIMVTAGRMLASERADENTESPIGLLLSNPLALIVTVLVTWLLRLVAVLILGMALASLVAVLMLSQVMFGISLIVGPILVPWLIWKRSEFLFDGWLKFTIAAFMTKVVAAIMVVIIFITITSIKKLSEGVLPGSGLDMVAVDGVVAFCICIISSIMVFLMWQVPNLATSLISGGTATAQKFGQGTISRQISGSLK